MLATVIAVHPTPVLLATVSVSTGFVIGRPWALLLPFAAVFATVVFWGGNQPGGDDAQNVSFAGIAAGLLLHRGASLVAGSRTTRRFSSR